MKKGNSLVELIIYMSLFLLLLFGVTYFLKIFINSRARIETVKEVFQRGIQIEQIFDHTIRKAQKIEFPGRGNSGDELRLEMDDNGVNPTVFSLENGVLKIKEGNQNSVNLGREKIIIKNLEFKNASYANTPGVAEYSFLAEYDGSGGVSYAERFSGSISLRQKINYEE